MDNSYNKNSTYSGQSGFTLIEIVVVLAIMGGMIAVVGINLKPNIDRLARLEASRFLAVVNEVRDEAIISGESFFLVVDSKAFAYRFEGVRADRNASQDEGLFRVRVVRDGVELDWEVFDQFEDEDGKLVKRVLITPLGEISSFDAQFKGEEYDYHVFVNEQSILENHTKDAYRL